MSIASSFENQLTVDSLSINKRYKVLRSGRCYDENQFESYSYAVLTRTLSEILRELYRIWKFGHSETSVSIIRH